MYQEILHSRESSFAPSWTSRTTDDKSAHVGLHDDCPYSPVATTRIRASKTLIRLSYCSSRGHAALLASRLTIETISNFTTEATRTDNSLLDERQFPSFTTMPYGCERLCWSAMDERYLQEAFLLETSKRATRKRQIAFCASAVLIANRSTLAEGHICSQCSQNTVRMKKRLTQSKCNIDNA